MKGENLRKALRGREVNGQEITFTEIAVKLGMTPQAFSSKLRAKRVHNDFVKRIADALGITVDELEGKKAKTNARDMAHAGLLIKAQQELIISQQEQIRLHQKLELLQDKLAQSVGKGN